MSDLLIDEYFFESGADTSLIMLSVSNLSNRFKSKLIDCVLVFASR